MEALLVLIVIGGVVGLIVAMVTYCSPKHCSSHYQAHWTQKYGNDTTEYHKATIVRCEAQAGHAGKHFGNVAAMSRGGGGCVWTDAESLEGVAPPPPPPIPDVFKDAFKK